MTSRRKYMAAVRGIVAIVFVAPLRKVLSGIFGKYVQSSASQSVLNFICWLIVLGILTWIAGLGASSV